MIAPTASIKSVTVERFEGPNSITDWKLVTPSLEEAERFLTKHRHTAPKDGGYDKCGFKIEWENGVSYEGRYDLSRDSDCNLLAQVRTMCSAILGHDKRFPANLLALPRYVEAAKTLSKVWELVRPAAS